MWGSFRDYTKCVLSQLEAPKFAARVARLATGDARKVMRAIAQIRLTTDPRLRWSLGLQNERARLAAPERVENAFSAVRRLYFEVLEAAGFAVSDPPVHSRALREFSRRAPAPAFRLLYGVHAERQIALVALGEWLDRSYYGDSVRRAERLWQGFLTGELTEIEPLERR
jgi:hypothetical protein